MSAFSTRMTKTRKVSIAGIAAAGVAALTLSLAPAGESDAAVAVAEPQAAQKIAPVAMTLDAPKTLSLDADQSASAAKVKAAADAAAKKAAAEAAATKKAAADAAAKKKAAAEAAAKKRAADQAASRAAARKPVYANNLDGWIRESLDIMKKHKIPGSYQGLHKNIIRESSGNPNAINNWDINAINGVPSIGLLQVIKPTFDAYHVAGTKHSQYDPVANIVAAANYAADRYGSIDNVNSAY
ncbi:MULTISPECIES: transglycosylase SLT domain-containing protein [unclassified Streptomyces]|uniref:transglycosylase SLT domain-containing protein n=1 Tax=unclassified Streptomyces TaxID=2593676 RepID=UPI0028C4D938|nr:MULTISPECIES: transglycosylase SLT domain-containing protein [unclassified Streptomyces]WNO75393.1 transglycosylase SLT domain-containing protein [Streptomyces sp. AM8-1-1]